MPWTVVNFGKFRGKGKTLPQILFTDPDWFFFLIEKEGFANKGALAAEAADLDQKGRNIRIPNQAGQQLVAEYFIHPPTGKFGGVQVVPVHQSPHQGSSPTQRKTVLDMSFPRSISGYDKLGNRTHIRDLKAILFRSGGVRMTKQRAEDFFDDAANFQL